MSQNAVPHRAALVASSTISTVGGGSIRLDCFDLDRLSVSHFESLPGEMKQASRYKIVLDANRFLGRRLILRFLVAELNQLKPDQVKLVQKGGNRPSIRGLSRFEFNTSHSGATFIVATSFDSIPGIDVEIDRFIPDVDSLISRICSAGEQEDLGGGSAISSRRFLEIWTRKESVLKSLGLGLKVDPAKVTIPVRMGPLEDWEQASVDATCTVPSIDLITPVGFPAEIICSLAVHSGA